jgi:hypothetical protein
MHFGWRSIPKLKGNRLGIAVKKVTCPRVSNRVSLGT